MPEQTRRPSVWAIPAVVPVVPDAKVPVLAAHAKALVAPKVPEVPNDPEVPKVLAVPKVPGVPMVLAVPMVPAPAPAESTRGSPKAVSGGAVRRRNRSRRHWEAGMLGE